MTSITFFFFLIPVLAILLLAINFLFATHTPYEEKNSAFECGFHSFLGQNRMQFNISFYIFGLLFLLFDLEILLIYPYPVSSYFNSIYGLCIMLIFFLILTLGFAFELGKNALKIDSRQYDNNDIVYKNNKFIESNLFYSVRMHYFISYILPLWILKNLPYITIALFIVNIISPILCDPGDTTPEPENNTSNQENSTSNQENNTSNQENNTSNQQDNATTLDNIRNSEAGRHADELMSRMFQNHCERNNLDPNNLLPEEYAGIKDRIVNNLKDFRMVPSIDNALNIMEMIDNLEGNGTREENYNYYHNQEDYNNDHNNSDGNNDDNNNDGNNN